MPILQHCYFPLFIKAECGQWCLFLSKAWSQFWFPIIGPCRKADARGWLGIEKAPRAFCPWCTVEATRSLMGRGCNFRRFWFRSGSSLPSYGWFWGSWSWPAWLYKLKIAKIIISRNLNGLVISVSLVKFKLSALLVIGSVGQKSIFFPRLRGLLEEWNRVMSFSLNLRSGQFESVGCCQRSPICFAYLAFGCDSWRVVEDVELLFFFFDFHFGFEQHFIILIDLIIVQRWFWSIVVIKISAFWNLLTQNSAHEHGLDLIILLLWAFAWIFVSHHR